MASRKSRQKRKAKRRERVERSTKETKQLTMRQSQIRSKVRKIIEPEKKMPSEILDQADWYEKMYGLSIVLGLLLVVSLLIHMAAS